MRIRRYKLLLFMLITLPVIFFVVFYVLPRTIDFAGSRQDELVIELIAWSLTSLIALAVTLIGRRLLHWSRSLLLTPEERRLEEETRFKERVYLKNVLEWLSGEDALGVYTELDATSPLKPRIVPLSWHVMDHSAQSTLQSIVQREYTETRRSLVDLVAERRRLVIKGNPGSGKTLTLKWLAQQFARRALTHHDLPLPLFVRLREYRGGVEGKPQPFFDFVLGHIREHYPNAPFQERDSLNLYLGEGRIVLLLDGLNEIPITDYHDYSLRLQEINVFSKELYPRCQCIVSCRSLHYDPLLDISAVEILDFDDGQSLAFLERFLDSKEKANDLFRVLRSAPPQIFALAHNPFFLTLIAEFFKDFGESPTTTSELLRKIVEKRLEKASSPELVVKYLRDLAWKMHQAGFFGAQVPKEWIVHNHPSGLEKDALEVAEEAELVDIAADGDVSFYHHVFQEYFAALELVRIPGAIKTYIDAPAWEETVVLALRLMAKDERYLLRFLPTDSEIEGDPSKSADRILLLAKGHRELPESAADTVKIALIARAQKLLEVLPRVRVADEWPGEAVLTFWPRSMKVLGVRVADAWTDEAPPPYSTTYVRVTLLYALGLIDNSRAVKLTEKTIGKDRSWISELGLEVLSSMTALEAMPSLLSALARQLGITGILTLLRMPEYLPREVKRWLRRQQIILIVLLLVTLISLLFLCGYLSRLMETNPFGAVIAVSLVMLVGIVYLLGLVGMVVKVFLSRIPDLYRGRALGRGWCSRVKVFLSRIPDLYQAGPRKWIRALRKFIRSESFVVSLAFIILLLVLFFSCLSLRGGPPPDLVEIRHDFYKMVVGFCLMTLILATGFYWNLFREARSVLMRASLWIHSLGGFTVTFVLPIIICWAGVMLPIALNVLVPRFSQLGRTFSYLSTFFIIYLLWFSSSLALSGRLSVG